MWIDCCKEPKKSCLSLAGQGKLAGDAYYIETYGCQMNEHDSEKMARLLEDEGLTPVDSAELADVIVINTCAIREKPEHKVYSALGRVASLKKKNPRLVAIVAGCVAQQHKNALLSRVQSLDGVLGTHCISDLAVLVKEIRRTGRRLCKTDFYCDAPSLHLPSRGKASCKVFSYVTIMQGCSNFCAYCIVPYTRGPEQSRRMREIVDEVEQLADQGVKEITLLGQNVNAYGKDLGGEETFTRLLPRLSEVEGIQRIRFTTSHPKDFDEELAWCMRDLEKVCEHLHLPLQAGSNRVLRAMKRRYTYGEYYEKVALLRRLIPKVAITTDIIVGFPGETDEDFEETCEALRDIRFDQIFSFKYSSRPGTAAASLPGHIPETVKQERLFALHEIQSCITEEYHAELVGSIEEVLVEGARRQTRQPYGRTRSNKVVNIETNEPVQPGDVRRVRITRALKHSLVGILD